MPAHPRRPAAEQEGGPAGDAGHAPVEAVDDAGHVGERHAGGGQPFPGEDRVVAGVALAVDDHDRHGRVLVLIEGVLAPAMEMQVDRELLAQVDRVVDHRRSPRSTPVSTSPSHSMLDGTIGSTTSCTPAAPAAAKACNCSAISLGDPSIGADVVG